LELSKQTEPLQILTDQWLSTAPVAMPLNYSPDIYPDEKVNLLDFDVMAFDRLNCNDPGMLIACKPGKKKKRLRP
jgi:hypothetical protein